MIAWLLRAFAAAALAGFSAAVWFAGPLVGFADGKPLETASSRIVVIVAAVGTVALYYGLRALLKWRAQRAIAAAIANAGDPSSDAGDLELRIREAIATLKKASGRRNFLYEMPWYVIIGPPGAGKTTALINSGLDFPLSGAGKAQPVPGVGGTRACDWWFTDQAVLIDTAGRYTTQESDAQADATSWLGFLSLLKTYRSRQPINGVVLAISLLDLMTSTAVQQSEHVSKIRDRLAEIQTTLRIDFPVYVLFTKADLVSGFTEYFAALDEDRRRQVWGTTFQSAERGGTMAGAVSAEFEALAQRLTEETPDRLRTEPDAATRIRVFAFAGQFEALKGRVSDFIAGVFAPDATPSRANLRGFYFSSGTQEGTPIDQLLGVMGRSFGGVQPQLSGRGKSFFLHDLLSKVIFAESGWVSFDEAAERRAVFGRYGAIGAIVGISVVAMIAFGVSFGTNLSLISETRTSLDQYRQSATDLTLSPSVSDVDLENVIGPLDILRNLAIGYENRTRSAPAFAMLGLGQRDRLRSPAEAAYRQALERMFRSRLLLQIERTLQSHIADPAALYEPLKIYLMLCGKSPKADDELIVSWVKNDWENNRYPGAHNREGRVELEKHLRAMLAMDDEYDPVYQPNVPLVQAVQRSLGRMTLADRASALIKSATYAADLDDFSVAQAAGPEAPLVFERVDGGDLSTLRVPGIYTFHGFTGFYLPQLAKIAQTLTDDQWVIGGGGEQGSFDQDLLRLGPELLDRYDREFSDAWNGALDRVKLKSLSADKPDYLALSAVAAKGSPIQRLFETIATETMLTRQPDTATISTTRSVAYSPDVATGLFRIGIDLANGKSQSRAGDVFVAIENPGAAIEARFRPFQALISGKPGQRPIDSLTQNFREIYQSLRLAVDIPSQSDRAAANLQLQISTLRANASRLPKQLAAMVRNAADDFEGDATSTSTASLNQKLAADVTAPCEEIVADRYPFAASSPEDVRVGDFARLFAPGGIMDRFFAQNLSGMVEMGGQTWAWKQDTKLGRDLSSSALRSFELATQIRDAYFPLGGGQPAVTMTITPFSLNGDADAAMLTVNGQTIQSSQAGNSPATISWPGAIDGPGSASLTLTPEIAGRDSTLKFDGPWALKRLMDVSALSKNGDNLEARFVIGGRDVAYLIKGGAEANPFALSALTSFSCPSKF